MRRVVASAKVSYQTHQNGLALNQKWSRFCWPATQLCRCEHSLRCRSLAHKD